jgi:hypothetical protein
MNVVLKISQIAPLWLRVSSRVLVIANLIMVALSSNQLNAQLNPKDLSGFTIRSIGPRIPNGSITSVDFDFQLPYNILAATRKDGFWRGPANVWEKGGITNHHWNWLGRGSGAAILTNRIESKYSYLIYAHGGMGVSNRDTGAIKRIDPWAPDGVVLRHASNPPALVDREDFLGLYYGSQFVHKSTNGGLTWQIISGDLTNGHTTDNRIDILAPLGTVRNVPAITKLMLNPVDPEVIWAATNDGNLFVSISGGGQWENKKSRVRGLPDFSVVSHIHPSTFSPASAIVVFESVEDSGDRRTDIYKTEDYGNRWDRISEGRDILGPVYVVVQDALESQLLFAGAEDGLYVSLNEGDQWIKWPHTFPTTPLHALAIHPVTHDLITGTDGRNVLILDDISPLRSIITDAKVLNSDISLFQPSKAYLHANPSASGGTSRGDYAWDKTNKPYGAAFYYWIGSSDLASEVSIEILDFENKIVRTLVDYPQKGVNHFVWDLREEIPESLRRVENLDGNKTFLGVEVLPGNYKIRIKQGLTSAEGSIEVLGDPRIEVPLVDRITKYQALNRYLEIEGRVVQAHNWVTRVDQGLGRIIERLLTESAAVGSEELRMEALKLQDRLDIVGDFSGVYQYRKQVSNMFTSYDAPTEGQRLDLLRMEEAFQSLFGELEEFNYLELEVHAEKLRAIGIEPFFFPALIPPG